MIFKHLTTNLIFNLRFLPSSPFTISEGCSKIFPKGVSEPLFFLTIENNFVTYILVLTLTASVVKGEGSQLAIR